MHTIFKGDTGLIPVYVYGSDSVTPAAAVNLTWQYKKPDGTTVSLSTAPATAPTLALQGAGNVSGTYDYIQTYLVSVNSQIIETASSAPLTVTASANVIRITYADITSVAGATGRRFWRRLSGATNWMLVAEITTLTASYYDDNAIDIVSALQPVFWYGNSQGYLRTNDTSTAGVYTGLASFTLKSGDISSSTINWEVIDPLSTSTLDVDATIDMAWAFLEDCYDAVLGGPHLKDESFMQFDKGRLHTFLEVALFDINNFQPVQEYGSTSFPYAQARPLLAKGILLESIRHLMRSYVEQPLPQGAGQISYLQRRDYLERWKTVYDMESEQYKTWLVMFKRQQYNFGSGKVLVDTKTGRRLYYPALRTRYPRVGGYFL